MCLCLIHIVYTTFSATFGYCLPVSEAGFKHIQTPKHLVIVLLYVIALVYPSVTNLYLVRNPFTSPSVSPFSFLWLACANF